MIKCFFSLGFNVQPSNIFDQDMTQAIPSQSGNPSNSGSDFSPMSQRDVPLNLSPQSQVLGSRSINSHSIFRSSGKHPIRGINLPSASLPAKPAQLSGINLPSSALYDSFRQMGNRDGVGRNIVSPGLAIGQRAIFPKSRVVPDPNFKYSGMGGRHIPDTKLFVEDYVPNTYKF